MLEAGTLDIALVQGEVVHEALSGIGRPPADLRIITAMYPTAGMFVVRADSALSPIADLKGKPVAWGAQGSGLVILGRYAMDGLGLDAAKDFQPIYLERAGDGPAMVLDGRAAALWGGGAGWPGFTTVAKSEKGARFIAPDAEEIARILAKHPFLKPVTQAGRQLPRPGRRDPLGRLVELRDGAARPRRCRGLPVRQGVARAGQGRQPAAATGRDHGAEHAGRRAARAPASRCRTLLPGSGPDSARNLGASRGVSWTGNQGAVHGRQAEEGQQDRRRGQLQRHPRLQRATAKFLKKGKVDEAAQEAKRALESKEGAELKAAEAKGKAGDPKHWEKNPGRPK